MRLELKVNGISRELEIQPHETLLEVLRDRLGLRSVKKGCGTGECGTCVVLRNGEPVNTCILPAAEAQGWDVVTLEGFTKACDPASPLDRLSILQKAFLEHGAVQCGFCTSGMIAAAQGLLESDPRPSRSDIRGAISGNLCRCTGYVKIVDAVEAAAAELRGETVPDGADDGTGSNIGRNIAREDAIEIVTGNAVFLDDVLRPGMAFGAILRSPHAHARIVRIDASRALEVPGVLAFVSGAELPDAYYGVDLKDQQVFARGKVRYVGEPVAALAAETPALAEEALGFVEVEYEPLPMVLDAREAMRPDAPIVHERLAEYELGFQTERYGNVCTAAAVDYGDTEKGFREADLVVEGEFISRHQQHAPLEVHGAVAEWDDRGRVTVWSTTQKPFAIRRYLGQSLRMDFSKIRVVATRIGGGFGSKLELHAEPYALLLARASGRPVKVVYSREDDLSSVVARHATWFRIRTGVRRDGTISAREIEFVFDTGAYSGNGPTTLTLAAQVSTGLYRVPSQKVRGFCVYTNKMNCGSFRGPSAPQTTFAIESHTDDIARKLGMDPLEFRLRNLLREGELTGFGQRLRGVDYAAVARAAAERAGWREAKAARSRTGTGPGIGMACVYWLTGGWSTSAQVRIAEDGTVLLFIGATDMGTGYLFTSVRQMTAEALGIRAEEVVVVQGDTDEASYDHGIGGSRGSVAVGTAALRAAEAARDRLLEAASRMLGVQQADLESSGGKIRVRGDPGRSLSFGEISYAEHMKGGGPVVGTYSYLPAMDAIEGDRTRGLSFPAFGGTTMGCHVAVASLDEVTGAIEVHRVVAAHDVGRAINPRAAEGQIEGGVALGLGFGLLEEMKHDAAGRMVNASFADYKLPHSTDVPEILPVLVEIPSPDYPFGAKGLGEPTMAPVAAAVRNAVLDATGLALTETPMSPERNYGALSNARGAKPC